MKSPAAQMEQMAQMAGVIEAYGRLEKIHSAFDGAARELEQARAAPLCVRCGNCCRTNTVHAWHIEGQFVRSLIAGNGSLTRILDCCKSWLLDRLPGVTTYGVPPGGGMQKWPHFGEELSALMRSPCPFLADNACSIYRARPLACRAYGVTRMTAPGCSRPIGVGETERRRAWYGGEGGLALQRRQNAFLAGLPPLWRQSWFLPTLLYSLLRPGDFAALVESGKVATAKLMVGGYSPDIIWQSQMEAIGNLN